jgi:hypothetical protein
LQESEGRDDAEERDGGDEPPGATEGFELAQAVRGGGSEHGHERGDSEGQSGLADHVDDRGTGGE